MEEKLREEGTMQQDSKKKKRRFPIIIPIVILLCAIFGGLLATGILKVPTIGGHFVDVETAALIKKASDVKDELTLRELLLLDMELDITVTEDMTIDETFMVNGAKTLYGDATITVDAMGTFAEIYAFEVAKGASLTVDGLTIDGRGMALGVMVNQRAELTVLSCNMQYMYKGIVTNGKVTIEDIKMEWVSNKMVHAMYQSEVQVKKGTFLHSGGSGLYVDTNGSMTVEEDVVVKDTVGTCVYSTGDLAVHGGSFGDGKGYGIQVYSGTAHIEYQGSDPEGYIEVYNTNGAGLYVRSDKDTVISRVHVDTTGTNALFVQKIENEKTKVDVSDCVFENTKGNTISAIKQVNLKDVTVHNSGASALYCRPTSEITLENFTGVNNKSCGMYVDGATIKGNNVTFDGCGVHGVRTVEMDQSPVKLELTDVTITGAKKNNFNIQTGSEVVLRDSVLKESVRTNVYVEKGSTLTMENVQVLGTTDRGIPNVTATTEAKITLNNCTVSDANGRGLNMDKGGAITMNDTSVSNNAMGGVQVSTKSTFNMNSGSIYDNKTPGGGAGVVVFGTMNFKGGSIYNNTAVDGGGGINVTYDKNAGLYGTLNMTGGTIKNNTASAGGGIHVSNNTTANLRGGHISGNVATGDGDGILDNGYVNISGNFYMPSNDIYLCTATRVVNIKGSILSKHSAKDPLLVTPYVTTSIGTAVVECDSNSAVKSLLNTYVASGNRAFTLCENEKNNKTMTVSYNDADMDMTGADKVYVSTFEELKKAVESTKDKRFVIICDDIQMEGLITVPLGTTVYIRDDGVTRILSRAEGNTERFFRTYYGTGLYVAGTSYGSLVLDGETSGDIDPKKVAKFLEVRGTTEIRNVAMKNNGTAEAGANGAFIKQEYGKLYVYSSLLDGGVGATGSAIYVNKGSAHIEDSIFANNKSTYSGGALLANKGTELTVVSTTFKDNQSGTNGGAINAMNATLNVTDSIFQNNISGANGGAVAATENSTVTMTNATYAASKGFEENSASGSAGAIYLNNAIATISGYTFDGNQGRSGGAINTGNNVTLEITDATFTNNASSVGSGGAIVSNAKSLTLNNVNFVGNQSKTNGGAINFDKAGLLTATNCNFISNQTNGENGGAVAISNGSSATFKGTGSFTGNKVVKAGQVGGAIYMNASAGKVSITGYTFTSNAASIGGAININQGQTDADDIVLTDCKFTDNKADAGNGGAINNLGRNLKITTCEFTSNTTSKQGGAIFVNAGTNEIKNSKFGLLNTDNSVSGGNTSSNQGGALWINAGATVTMEDSIVADNQATGASGGAIYVKGILNVDNTDFADNDAKSTAGAINCDAGGQLNANDCDFINNHANGGDSGAVGVTSGSKATFTGKGTFSGNTATVAGGAINTNNSELSVDGYTFTNNSATEGGAINIKNGTTVGEDASALINVAIVIENSVFEENAATTKAGGAINNVGRILTVEGCTFGAIDKGNTAKTAGGAIYTNAAATVIDSDFVANSALEDGGAIYVNKGITLTNSDFASNSGRRGGAVYVNNMGSGVSINGGTYTYNSAAYAGGAFNQGSGSATIQNVTMQYNTAGAYEPVKNFGCGGGAMMLGGSMSLTLTNSTVNNNGSIYTGNVADFHASDITFRDNGGGIPKLVLTDSSFDGVVTWNEETSTGDYGRVQFKTLYTGNGITFCKPSYIELGKSLVEFSGTWTPEYKAATVAKITVRGDYTSPTEYAIGQYCVTMDSANTYGVLRGCEASITKDNKTTYYETLGTAVTAATSGDTITVLRSITADATVTVDKAITVTNKANSDVVIYRGTTSNVFNVTKDGNLTITKAASGSITLDGRTEENATKATPDTVGTSGSPMISLNAGELTLTGVTLQYGNCSSNGGALLVKNGGNLTASGTVFKNNKAGNSGGAILVDSSSASTIDIKDNSQFLYNEAAGRGGGAIYFNKSAGVVSNLYLTNTTFQGNHSKSQDGAVQVGGDATTFIVDSCNFIENYSAGDGGAVGVTSSTKKAEFKGTGTFQGNYTTGSGKAGGAINTNGSAISITGYTFDGNYAPQGGAINIKNGAAADKSAVTIAKCIFTSNYSTTGVGGAIYNQGRNVNITDCKFGGTSLGNTAKTQGGAIYHTTGTMTFTVGENTTGCVFDNNSAEKGGGAIYMAYDANDKNVILNITGYDFTNNKVTSSQAGGAIYMNGGTLNLTGTTNSKFYNNSASSQGGAIRMGGSSIAYITDYLFDTNQAANEGGAIRCGGKLYTNNCAFTNNKTTSTSGAGGGAIYATDSAVLYVLADETCNFTGNTSASSSGAGNANALRANSKSTIYLSTNYQFGATDTYMTGATTAKIETTTNTYKEVTGK